MPLKDKERRNPQQLHLEEGHDARIDETTSAPPVCISI